MVTKFRLREVILGSDGEPCLVERVEPGFGILLGDPQRGVGERFSILTQLAQIGFDCFSRGPKEPSQFWFDVNLPLRAKFLFVRPSRRTEETPLGGRKTR